MINKIVLIAAKGLERYGASFISAIKDNVAKIVAVVSNLFIL
jgi:hypothetical protein